ncbi:MAG TPA: tyrosine-type recombinase/integrase [Bryobacteraceae bacterium]|jgi:integrase/recombinase XerC|nr:tyrosine-type recombinase/integrase [Bryobacteraceae bacterium]
MIKSEAMLTIWRRHTANCPHREKGRGFLKCNCPLWADGYLEGKRTLRQSLKTRDMARARAKAVAMESPVAGVNKPIPDAVKAFFEHCQSEGLKGTTISKYRNALGKLADFCETERVDFLEELKTEKLDQFRAGRGIQQITACKELEILRAFFGFCVDRNWMKENPGKKIKLPRNLKPNEVVPFTPAEVAAILMACDRIGKKPYERLRARAIILTLRYTALRIGDVSLLARDRISIDGDKWRIFIRTEKSGQPVFLPVPPDLKAALDCVPPPLSNINSRYFFWNGTGKPKTHKAHIDRCLRVVFKESGVPGAHAHRFRHTLATELLGRGASFEDVADILGNSPAIVRKHYGKWSAARQTRIDDLMGRVYMGTDQAAVLDKVRVN